MKFEWVDAFTKIPREPWTRLVTAAGAPPFFDWFWLAGLEDTRCASDRTGWSPQHLTVWEGDELIAAAPLYVKEHSRGEFVFDHEWVEVSHQLKVDYYPKLLGMSPFTPAMGYRFFVDAAQDEREICAAMMAEIDRYCADESIHSCHFLHADPAWREVMTGVGVSDWLHHALIWENHDFGSFDDYLATFKSKQRKNIKRERRLVTEQGIRFQVIPGKQAPPEYFLLMYLLYTDTCDKFWGWSQYLNQQFFMHMAQALAEHIVLVAAFAESEEVPVAMSLLVRGDDTLYGRYWGCRESFDQLHFETCYYQPIEWAIAQKIRYFDAGSGNAQHKQKRGFPARANYSLHRHYHPVMRKVWDANIPRLNQVEQMRIDYINNGCKELESWRTRESTE